MKRRIGKEETGSVSKRRRLWVYCRVEEAQRRRNEKEGVLDG